MTAKPSSIQLFSINLEQLESGDQAQLSIMLAPIDQRRIYTLGSILHATFSISGPFDTREMVVLSILPMLSKEAVFFAKKFIDVDTESTFAKGDLESAMNRALALVDHDNPRLLLQVVTKILEQNAQAATDGNKEYEQYAASMLMAEMFFMNAPHMSVLFNGLAKMLADIGATPENC